MPPTFHSFVLALAALPTALGKIFAHSSNAPDGWDVSHRHSTSSLKQQVFTIALNVQNIDKLESKLLELSTPGSPNYGQWMTDADVNNMFSPSKAAISGVLAWLKSSGVKNYKIEGPFIDFAIDVQGANSLLDADYQYYVNNGTTKLRTLSYSIPDALTQHIRFVDPSTNFGKPISPVPIVAPVVTPSRTIRSRIDRRPTKRSVDASCQTSITPSCLKQMYNIGNYTADPKSGSSIGFSSFLNQSALYSDVFQFEDTFGIPRQNFSTILVNGAKNDQNPATASYGEADLDAENIVGIAHPLPFVEYITGGSP